MKAPPDHLDTLLDTAFQQALNEAPVDLVEAVLRRIHRRQRIRLLVLGLVGTVAAAIAVVNGLPLLNSLETALADTALPAWHISLPVLALLAAGGIFCGWLLLEEPA